MFAGKATASAGRKIRHRKSGEKWRVEVSDTASSHVGPNHDAIVLSVDCVRNKAYCRYKKSGPRPASSCLRDTCPPPVHSWSANRRSDLIQPSVRETSPRIPRDISDTDDRWGGHSRPVCPYKGSPATAGGKTANIDERTDRPKRRVNAGEVR